MPWLEAIERLARSFGLAGRRALDVACGTGKSLEALLELGFEAIGCDVSPGMAEVARLDEPGGRAVVAMDVMSRRRDGLWRRASASWDHWHYPLATIPAIAAAAGLEMLAVRGQRAGGRLEPNADEARYHKALFLVRGARRERRPHALAAVDR